MHMVNHGGGNRNSVCVSDLPRELNTGFSAETLLLEGAVPGVGMSARKNQSRQRNSHIYNIYHIFKKVVTREGNKISSKLILFARMFL